MTFVMNLVNKYENEPRMLKSDLKNAIYPKIIPRMR